MNAPLRKTSEAASRATRLITLVHAHSGATKLVEYLGMAGRPHRAQIWWPGAGDYLIAPRSGKLCGSKKTAATRSLWRVADVDRAFLSQEWRLARARAQMPRARPADKTP